MTDQERILQDKLNAVLVDGDFEKAADEEKAEQKDAIKALRDRMAKLEELMKEL